MKCRYLGCISVQTREEEKEEEEKWLTKLAFVLAIVKSVENNTNSSSLIPSLPFPQLSSLAVWNARASNESWEYERPNLFWCHVTEQSCKLETISERCEVVWNKMCLCICTHAESLRSVHGFLWNV